MFLNELLSRKDIEKIENILSSETWSFDELVEISGLDRRYDFRYVDLQGCDLSGADLRGYDFTGSDLRDCIRDTKTLVDETTVFTDTNLRWVDSEQPIIVEKMFEVQQARSTPERRKSLAELTNQYPSESHIHLFLKNSIEKTKSLDAFFDYLDFFEAQNENDESLIKKRVTDFVLSSSRRNNRWRGSGGLSAASLNSIISRISETDNFTVQKAYSAYLNASIDAGRVSLDSSKYEVSDDLKRLIAVLE